MRILSVFWLRQAVTGGHERFLHLLRGLADRGHDITVFTKAEYSYDASGLKTIEMDEGWVPSQKLDALRAIFSGKENFVEAKSGDGADAIVSFGLGSAIPSMYLKLSLDTPMLLGLRSYPPENVVQEEVIFEVARRSITSMYLRAVLRGADRVIMQTEAQQKKLVGNHKARCEETAVIRNNIRGKLEEGTESRRARRLLFAGTLKYRKGLDTLLQALSLITASTEAIHLHVAGKGPMEEKAMSYVEENGLCDHVTFHGYVEDVKALMRKADLVVIPSRFDSFPNVGLEAMGVGTPFIVSDLTDVRSAFGSVTQYVRPGDPERLARKLASLQKPDQYRRLREQCISHRSSFDFDWVGEFESEIRRMV